MGKDIVSEVRASEFEPGIGAIFHIVNLLLKKKIGFNDMKKFGDLAIAIEKYEEYEIKNVIKTVLVGDCLQIFLYIEHGWVYNCTLPREQCSSK